CVLAGRNTLCFSRPYVPAPLWHSRHIVKTTGRRSSFAFVVPCGTWHASHPSTRTLACSKTNGPRLSTWHRRQGSSLSKPRCSMAEFVVFRDVMLVPPPDVLSNEPCGLWQSVH